MFGCGEVTIFQQRMMIWKNASSNFVEPLQSNQESALFFLLDHNEFTDWSEVQQRFGSGEIAIFQQGGPKRPPHT